MSIQTKESFYQTPDGYRPPVVTPEERARLDASRQKFIEEQGEILVNQAKFRAVPILTSLSLSETVFHPTED